jgi:hypothetical protein
MNNMAPVWNASTPSRNEASSSLCIKLQGTLPTLPITVCGYDSGNNEQGNEKKNKKNERRGEEEEKKKEEGTLISSISFAAMLRRMVTYERRGGVFRAPFQGSEAYGCYSRFTSLRCCNTT